MITDMMIKLFDRFLTHNAHCQSIVKKVCDEVSRIMKVEGVPGSTNFNAYDRAMAVS
jgi:hypothetical protein